jgi:hypothetical protein
MTTNQLWPNGAGGGTAVGPLAGVIDAFQNDWTPGVIYTPGQIVRASDDYAYGALETSVDTDPTAAAIPLYTSAYNGGQIPSVEIYGSIQPDTDVTITRITLLNKGDGAAIVRLRTNADRSGVITAPSELIIVLGASPSMSGTTGATVDFDLTSPVFVAAGQIVWVEIVGNATWSYGASGHSGLYDTDGYVQHMMFEGQDRTDISPFMVLLGQASPKWKRLWGAPTG